MKIITASTAIWATLVLAALTTTCGMIRAHLKEPVEVQLPSGKGQTVRQKMELIDEIKKLRDECLQKEDYYERCLKPRACRLDVYLCMAPYQDADAWNFVETIRRELDRIISDYKPEPVKHARWIDPVHGVYKCSNCRNYLYFRGLNAGRGSAYYCPHCGAKMVEYPESGEGDRL